MRTFRGAKKPKAGKPIFWVQPPGGRLHRIDPTDGRRTACRLLINDLTWSLPREETLERVLADDSIRVCNYSVCRGSLA